MFSHARTHAHPTNSSCLPACLPACTLPSSSRYEFNNPDDATTAGQGYPFRLRVAVTYGLSAAGRFDVAVSAENADVDGGWPLPYFNGWHPCVRACARACVRVCVRASF